MRILFWTAALAAVAAPAGAEVVWIEGEHPLSQSVKRHPWWYDQTKRQEFSGGDFLSHYDKTANGTARYRVKVRGGTYRLWVRGNPVKSALSWRLGDGEWKDLDGGAARDVVNVAGDGKPDLRFLGWFDAGDVTLKAGTPTIEFRFGASDETGDRHGYLDCFVLADEKFEPRGKRKPGEAPAVAKVAGWFPFAPSRELPESPIDLRFLNEKFAGEFGRIVAKDGGFVHEANGEPVRFWGVNGPSSKNAGDLRREAKLLARYGVNLVRLHGAIFEKNGTPSAAARKRAQAVVAAMKAEGIYTHLSGYFPLWFDPPANLDWLQGYNGRKHSFASLYFNREFEKRYQEWWRVLLTVADEGGKRLLDDPAVFGVELVNEDSFFFWTFNDREIPEPQLRIVESAFGEWLAKRHGSVAAALAKWNGPAHPRDRPAEGRVGFRGLWNLFNDRTVRDRETARFLAETQRSFYERQVAFLRGIGFKGSICCSNWTTASAEILGPLEQWSYLPGDFIDRHGYFAAGLQGDNSAWSVRAGHSYRDRSALRFDPAEPGKPKEFGHPAFEVAYDGKPTMISETTFERPNRFRTEAPLLFAAYGALQGTDAIVHFAFDGADWAVKPGFFMQPWTLASPTMLGQFPAAALIHRTSLVKEGPPLAEAVVGLDDLFALQGTPLPLGASLDELRAKDVPAGAPKAGGRFDPRLHYAGRAVTRFRPGRSEVKAQDLSESIDSKRQTIRSATGELTLDYGKGVLRIAAPAAQGLAGNLAAAGKVELGTVTISAPLDLGAVVVVALDGAPLAISKRMLVQAMSEERTTGFAVSPASNGRLRIDDLGGDPWQVKELAGSVTFQRPDAADLRVTALDHSGRPKGSSTRLAGSELKLQPEVLYYLIETTGG